MFTSRTRRALKTQWLLCLGLVCMVCGCAWLPADHEPLDFDTLTRRLPRDINRIIEFQEIDDQFSVAAHIGTFDWHPYPDLGCIMGIISSEGTGHAPSMGTIAFEETRDLPVQPLVVLQDYFYDHHVACIFVTEAGRALGGATLELTGREGETQVWQFVQGHAVIVADGETLPDMAPFAEYRLLDRNGVVIYSTDYIDWSSSRSYYQQFGGGGTYPTIRTVTPVDLEE